MSGVLDEGLYYADAPCAVFARSPNGKLVDGNSLCHNRILQNGSIL